MHYLPRKKDKWQEIKQGEVSCFYKGDGAIAQKITDNPEDIKAILEGLTDYTSGILETPDQLVAWVDHIRAWPVFYTHKDEQFAVSNNARKIQSGEELDAIDEKSCIEFAMSGYVSGDRTLYKDLKALRPGEFLVWDKSARKLTITRYHQYLPVMEERSNNWAENKKQLGDILDRLTLKMMDKANGRPIWIPLSGGLDSRILLCKLHEHGYKNLHTFTYGPKLNFESKIAKKVAAKLGVPWHFISPSRQKIRGYFESAERHNFWNETDGLKAISSMREFSALMALREKDLLSEDAILVNGQSGDYITGNHIAPLWFEDKKFTPEDLENILLGKHYELWQDLKTHENIDAIKERIDEDLPKDWKNAKTRMEWAALEEIWEYDARQICLVANGQRSYDFFGYDWEMPLWEKELVDFCEHLPLDQKKGQTLYKDYLREYNYQGLFPEKEPYIWRWPVAMLWVVPFAQIIGTIKGQKAKQDFYALMRYHGHYSNQFYSFPWRVHEKTYATARNVMSLNVRQWAIENSGIISKNILKRMKIDVD